MKNEEAIKQLKEALAKLETEVEPEDTTPVEAKPNYDEEIANLSKQVEDLKSQVNAKDKMLEEAMNGVSNTNTEEDEKSNFKDLFKD